MLKPFMILEVDELATDEEIKTAYLKKVRQFPPEKAPEKFQEIRDAYEAIKTEKLRLSYELFNSDKQNFVEFILPAFKVGKIERADETLFKAALSESLFSK